MKQEFKEIVLDVSTALSWVIPDEYSLKSIQFLSHFSSEGTFWVPALWWYELSNALVTAYRKKRLEETDLVEAIRKYQQLPFQTDSIFSFEQVRVLFDLAERHHLSSYDAAYLELAERRGVPLATSDRDLEKAARKAGVTVV